MIHHLRSVPDAIPRYKYMPLERDISLLCGNRRKKAYKAFVLEDMTNIIAHHKYIDRQLKL